VINPSDLSQQNIIRIKKTISELSLVRKKLLKRVEITENQIKQHQEILKKIEEERERSKKEIIIEDD